MSKQVNTETPTIDKDHEAIMQALNRGKSSVEQDTPPPAPAKPTAPPVTTPPPATPKKTAPPAAATPLPPAANPDAEPNISVLKAAVDAAEAAYKGFADEMAAIPGLAQAALSQGDGARLRGLEAQRRELEDGQFFARISLLAAQERLYLAEAVEARSRLGAGAARLDVLARAAEAAANELRDAQIDAEAINGDATIKSGWARQCANERAQMVRSRAGAVARSFTFNA